MFEISRLFTSAYYFDKNPGGDFLIGFALLAFFIAVIFTASFAKKISRNNKYLRKSFKKKLWFFPPLGVVGVILILSRFSAIPVFSMRLWLYSVFLLTIILQIYVFSRVYFLYKKRLTSATREKSKKGK